ncbi:MAG: winged helix-turn-helix transcriptional regulator [Exilispira sp.]|nr:winged helix-turn-helix transcriptional regulator [Exilispira sp.]
MNIDNLETPFLDIAGKINKKLFNFMFCKLSRINVHPGQPPVLLLLLEKEKLLNQVQIAEKINIKPSTVAVILRKMEMANLIEKKMDEKDRRVYYVSLTSKGEELAGQTKKIFWEMEQTILKDFTVDEKNYLIKMLNKIYFNLEKWKE